ncbi:Aminopeptidase C [Metamycoplasma arthritidis]|uniref:Aminopeptidase n=1 Tax=Metamycoplasma arthritidis (strain 158L3-1) TaxID=243272 RepID=B3PNJ2_META1|nr:C1 family peptidase [Metamycoplasma arthritidis]ACF07594.1 aminopeptidase C [Metamycoplasma arthritidis 158L3-1]VEU79102.1 Aminopeptidase C [Metamycoplasma arthritidis]
MRNIDFKLIQNYEKKYQADKANLVIENAIIKNGIRATATNNEVVKKHNFQFSIETKNVGSVTNQKQSGRCWIFAALNMARAKVAEALNIESIELSQNYIHFYDKLEKANTYLNFIIEKGLELDPNDRLFRYFADSPVQDGGYWEFFVDLINKYGVVPKSAMNETFHSEATATMVSQINWRLSAYTAKMRREWATSKDLAKINELKEEALYVVYNILIKSLGKPPKTFTFEYSDKDKKFQRIENISPLDFYKKYVGTELTQKIDLVADPRDKFPHNQLIHSDFIKSVSEGKGLNMLNVSLVDLKDAMIKSLQDGNAVWFGCDVGTDSDSKLGIMDPELFNYDLTLTKTPEFSKKEKFELRSSLISHAMNMVGVNLDKDGKPIAWKVENSWGEDVGKKGYFSMSDNWFDEYNYMAIVDKKYLSKEAQNALDKAPIEIDPWDPLC